MQKNLLTAMAALCFALATIAQAPTTGLRAYWPMNGNFSDAGPNGINGTNSGATATVNNINAVNTAMAFVNPPSSPTPIVNQFASHPVNALLNFGIGASFTVSFNVYLNSPFVGTGGIYDNNLNQGGYGVWFWQANGFPQVNFNWRNANVQTTSGATPLATWLNICCVATATSTSIYVNGVLNATNNVIGTWTPSYPLTGRWGTMAASGSFLPSNNYNGFNGKIDEVRIYNRALTLAEIQQIYALLPVQLTSFTAAKTGTDVALQWQTEYEQNSSHFNVQRSTDGVNFNNIGVVQAKGNTATASSYQYIDNTAKSITAATTIYYRLHQVDIDGRSQTSSIVTVKYETSNTLLTILQNPAINELRLQVALKQKQQVLLIITDAAGKTISTRQITVNEGNTFTALPLNSLSRGAYYITITAGEQKQTLPFIKQ